MTRSQILVSFRGNILWKNSVSYIFCLTTPQPGLLEASGSVDSEKYRFCSIKINGICPKLMRYLENRSKNEHFWSFFLGKILFRQFKMPIVSKYYMLIILIDLLHVCHDMEQWKKSRKPLKKLISYLFRFFLSRNALWENVHAFPILDYFSQK